MWQSSAESPQAGLGAGQPHQAQCPCLGGLDSRPNSLSFEAAQSPDDPENSRICGSSGDWAEFTNGPRNTTRRLKTALASSHILWFLGGRERGGR